MILGIDPGNNGGLSVLNGAGALLRAHRMPRRVGKVDWLALGHLLRELKALGVTEAAIERMLAFAGMKSSGATLENYGRLKLLLEQAGIPYTEYTPNQWQGAYKPPRRRAKRRVRIPGETEQETKVQNNRANKVASVQIANGMWPGAPQRFGKDWTDGTAEAALIGEQHRRKMRHERLAQ